ncbi:DNA helicase [Ameyamaea chiangmaiensis NBRC 103196]|uniref:helicase-related protein n=2 Tax=Ameyamaea chiangmaiensis TaxID=442969 RepID=UPI001FECC375|nr:helicase-related protein [Ameyamaea chiangmaiensis]GBQ71757.1 DNA helicase [Ameyamaea chiangmaiensis NBRC 103196]
MGSAFPSRVRAVLGSTNTGKTHLAIERLLAHRSGMIGFPLRLLARENYDRMVAQKGAGAVALITGEEKIIPAGARWYACTVEAMPLDRPVEFMAVDEIQLCADPDRGHVFTDRLLNARGMVETLFLGAETIRPLLQCLVPGITIDTRPRLSTLTHTGATRLLKLPPRSAIVAFSAAEVYAIAEAVRRRRGGCAVVMGQLSPRTRNAQVELYQNKEVDYLVATDAIGMGLNMDVDHVAFAGLSKFDGSRPRRLTAPEIAQIAGRAGRGMRDGTFGTTADCPPLDGALVEAVETHRFDPLDHLAWRNAALDFTSTATLLASLNRPPPARGLVPGRVASDVLTLEALGGDAEVRAACRDRRAVRLLWETCQIPDFRKIGDDSHERLCARVFLSVLRDGHLPMPWLAQQIDSLDRPEGDIDTLMQRLLGVRVCAYLTARLDWMVDAPHWQARTREIEDKLSDTLHERLIARFVDRRAATLIRRLDHADGQDALLAAVTRHDNVVVEGHTVGRMVGFGLETDTALEGDERRLMLRAARRALQAEIPRRLNRLVQSEDTRFALDTDRRLILWEDAPLARLHAGETLLNPRIDVIDTAFLDGDQRARIHARLRRYLDDVLHLRLAPLFNAHASVAARSDLRGIAHRLLEHGGVVRRERDEMPLSPPARADLTARGIVTGYRAYFMPALLKPAPALFRAFLIGLKTHPHGPVPALPAPGLVAIDPPHDARQARLLAALGWVDAGTTWLRLDVVERVTGQLARRSAHHPVAPGRDLASRLSIPPARLADTLQALGLPTRAAQTTLGPGVYGPLHPLLVLPPRSGGSAAAARRSAPVRSRSPDGPFAVLASLKATAK